MTNEDIIKRLTDLETRLASAEAKHTALVAILEKDLSIIKADNARLTSQIAVLSLNKI